KFSDKLNIQNHSSYFKSHSTSPYYAPKNLPSPPQNRLPPRPNLQLFIDGLQMLPHRLMGIKSSSEISFTGSPRFRRSRTSCSRLVRISIEGSRGWGMGFSSFR